MTPSSYSSQSTRPTGQVLGKNYSSFLDFTRNYEQTSGIFVPWLALQEFVKYWFLINKILVQDSKSREKYYYTWF